MIFAGCTSAPTLVAVQSTVVGCPLVIPCQLPASNPISNQGISSELDSCETAWHDCAAQIDMIIECQTKQEAKQKVKQQAKELSQKEGKRHE
ncbi:Rz1-like lysis system protein LysC [Shewanella sp. SM21]|nr:Rz1-like lysis system protein LysC [Shewanella sp. SM21]